MPMRFLLAAALALATFAARADLSENDLDSAARLREAALASPLAYELVTSLTTEVGSRKEQSSPRPDRTVERRSRREPFRERADGGSGCGRGFGQPPRRMQHR